MDKSGIIEGTEEQDIYTSSTSNRVPAGSTADRKAGAADTFELCPPLTPTSNLEMDCPPMCSDSDTENEVFEGDDLVDEGVASASERAWSDIGREDWGGMFAEGARLGVQSGSGSSETGEAGDEPPGLVTEEEVSDCDEWQTVDDDDEDDDDDDDDDNDEDEDDDEDIDLEAMNEMHRPPDSGDELSEEDLIFANMELFGNLWHMAERHSLRSNGGSRRGASPGGERGQAEEEQLAAPFSSIWANPPRGVWKKRSKPDRNASLLRAAPKPTPVVDAALQRLLSDGLYMDSLFALLPGVDSADSHLQCTLEGLRRQDPPSAG